MKRVLRYWLPLVLWMALIFSASADPESTARTSRFLVPFLRWFHPDVTLEQIDAVRWCVRKGAHMVEYAMLGWLTWRALWRPHAGDRRPWSWNIAGAALGICVLYAITDEVHQVFVPNRSGSVADVCIDAAGAAIGLLIVRAAYRLREGRA